MASPSSLVALSRELKLLAAAAVIGLPLLNHFLDIVKRLAGWIKDRRQRRRAAQLDALETWIKRRPGSTEYELAGWSSVKLSQAPELLRELEPSGRAIEINGRWHPPSPGKSVNPFLR